MKNNLVNAIAVDTAKKFVKKEIVKLFDPLVSVRSKKSIRR